MTRRRPWLSTRSRSRGVSASNSEGGPPSSVALSVSSNALPLAADGGRRPAPSLIGGFAVAA
jgi:hypothetical protein